MKASFIWWFFRFLPMSRMPYRLKRNVDADEVGKSAVYLVSVLSGGVTGENIFVDSGYNIIGL